MNLIRIFVAASLSAAVALPVAAENVWLSKRHDFGAFDENVGTVYCEFKLVNNGTEPISITGARANCGCTRPEYSTKSVAPGDTAVIRVGFDPKGRPGRFSKRINVDCSGDPRRTALTITGTVIGSSNTLKSRYPVETGPVRLRSATIAYGKVLKGETMGQYVDAYNASADTLRPRVEGSPKYIHAMIQPKVVPPGEQFIISTVLHSNESKGWGVVTDSLMFYPDAGSRTGKKIETVVILEENFSKLTPEQRMKAPLLDTSETALDLGKVSKGDSPIKRTFEISNRGKSPLVIRAISCPDAAVDVRLGERSVKPGKSAKVDVTVTPSRIKSDELLNARINIIANDPQHPSTMVRVVAEVK